MTLNKSIDLSYKEHIAFEGDNEHIQDRINNLFEIYTAGTETQEKLEFVELENKLKQTMTENYKYITMVVSIVETFTILILAISFYVLYNTTTMSNEHIISTILVLTYYLTYFSKISSNYIDLTEVFGYSRESDRFLKEIRRPNISTTPPQPGMALHGPIEFKNVNFKYPAQDKAGKPKSVLTNANLKM